MTDTAQAGWHPGDPAYRRLLVGLFFIGLATFAQLYAPQGLLPLIAGDLRISPDQAALMISAATLGLAIGVIPWSYVGDVTGRKPAMLVAISAACLFAVASAVMPSFVLTLVMRFFEGLMLGGVPALAVAYLNEEVGARVASIAAGTYISGTTLGGLAGRILAAPLGEVWGWRAGMLAATVLAIASVVVFVSVAPRSVHFTPGRTRSGFGAAALLGNLTSSTLWVIYLQGFLTMGGFVAMYNFLGFHLTEPPIALPIWLASGIFLAYLAGTFASPRAGALAARHGRKPVIIAGNLLMILGVLLCLVPVVWVVAAGALVLTAGFFSAHAVASGWAGAAAVTGRSQSASLYNLGYYGGSSLFGFLGGTFLHLAGFGGTVAMVVTLVLIATLLTVLVLPRG